MVQGFDRIVLAVPDLEEAVGHYQVLIGVRAQLMGEGRAWLGLPNTVLELVEDAAGRGHIQGLVMSDPAASDNPRGVDNDLDLSLAVCDGSLTAEFRQRHTGAQSTDILVDHLVLRTNDAQACVDLFAQRLGIRLALDKTVPEWGGRMLFFRAGKLTLEVIEDDGKEDSGNFFWGLAYQCSDLQAQALRLKEAGVSLSDIRDGRKPGTRVATVKSHHLGLPTLLIEPST